MKTKITFVAILLGFAVSTNAQKKIESSELPKPATAFLEKYFKKEAIDLVKKDAEHGEKGYEINLKNGTEIEFFKDGKIREVDGGDKPIPTGYIAASITDYVTKHYPNEKITHIDYGHKDIDVDLTNKIDLEFNKDGSFFKVD
ncbi:PepSY-like domain-containing protein [Flavobacterium noncentrifugens]|uniref:Putative beta-lactamase-inhibitor-like, PepSY-like n=1 Tax=Flavobacterium noncentrifugens TaxID=1128970 RepID=A0A1G8WQV4_9FLAO|nr:PepSY-like domain-containing protein [Flavobacterium noncentrifugens]SDJ80571.1 Putative beta-lactamase-inhibitor-like, PepSY-like [Flavobacterium noncentrifugens]